MSLVELELPGYCLYCFGFSQQVYQAQLLADLAAKIERIDTPEGKVRFAENE